MIRRIRLKYAFKCGKLEHKAGRVIAVPILLGIVLNGILKDWYNCTLFLVIFFTWLTYILAHTVEKKLFGHYGPRG